MQDSTGTAARETRRSPPALTIEEYRAAPLENLVAPSTANPWRCRQVERERLEETHAATRSKEHLAPIAGRFRRASGSAHRAGDVADGVIRTRQSDSAAIPVATAQDRPPITTKARD